MYPLPEWNKVIFFSFFWMCGDAASAGKTWRVENMESGWEGGGESRENKAVNLSFFAPFLELGELIHIPQVPLTVRIPILGLWRWPCLGWEQPSDCWFWTGRWGQSDSQSPNASKKRRNASGNWKGLGLGMHQQFAAGGRAGMAWKYNLVQWTPFSEVGAREGSDHRRGGWDRFGENRLVSAAKLYWKMVYIQGVVMGAWALNLLDHTDGLKLELILKLFPLSVK